MQDGLYGGVLKVRRVAVVGVAVFGVGRVVGGHGEAPFFGQMDVDLLSRGAWCESRRTVCLVILVSDRLGRSHIPQRAPLRAVVAAVSAVLVRNEAEGRSRTGPDVHRARASTLTANPP